MNNQYIDEGSIREKQFKSTAFVVSAIVRHRWPIHHKPLWYNIDYARTTIPSPVCEAKTCWLQNGQDHTLQ